MIVWKMFLRSWNQLVPRYTLLHGEHYTLIRNTSPNEIDLDFETYCFFLTRHPGLRKVRPYYFTFTTFTKGRWAKCWNIKMTFKTDKKMRKPHISVRKRKWKSIWSENSKFPLWRNVSWWVGFTICHFDQQVSSLTLYVLGGAYHPQGRKSNSHAFQIDFINQIWIYWSTLQSGVNRIISSVPCWLELTDHGMVHDIRSKRSS